ncbi:MAG: 3-keto-disaccharide hydrolase [Acidobacteriota bacterium]
MIKKLLLIVVATFLLAFTPEEGFTSLFDGETLDGWRKHTGLPASDMGGKWEVIDGAIVGSQDPPGKGGFLITNSRHDDFILTLETKLDWPADSGVFLRVGEDGKSHQVTLDYRPDGNIGALYLPWTQGSVFRNPEGEKYFKKDDWNDVKIQIQGEPARIQFWLNGHIVTDFQHTAETTQGVPRIGHIALQVHPGEVMNPDSKVYFRNIQIKPLPEAPPPPTQGTRRQ